MEVMQPPRRYLRRSPRVVSEPRLPLAGEPISPREREHLDLLLEGLSNKLMAARLGVSEHTSKFHVRNALAKLGTSNRVHGAVLWERRRAADAASTGHA